MELYEKVAYEASRRLTLAYSTSFGKSTKLLDKIIRPHIYAIYGLVRIADEIVDVYRGDDQARLLKDLEAETYAAVKRGYSANPIVHAFAITARQYDISSSLIGPFFESMAMDITPPASYTKKQYERYIYGSAEVVGLMCLRVFVDSDDEVCKSFEKGAKALGAAYQKVNFLRDMAADYQQLGRVYFPGVTFETFTEKQKMAIVQDCENDIKTALTVLYKLPPSSYRAVEMSLVYYRALLEKIATTPIAQLKQQRVRINDVQKLGLMAKTFVFGGKRNV